MTAISLDMKYLSLIMKLNVINYYGYLLCKSMISIAKLMAELLFLPAIRQLSLTLTLFSVYNLLHA